MKEDKKNNNDVVENYKDDPKYYLSDIKFKDPPTIENPGED